RGLKLSSVGLAISFCAQSCKKQKSASRIETNLAYGANSLSSSCKKQKSASRIETEPEIAIAIFYVLRLQKTKIRIAD
ncbi:MAG: hypothetical protein N2385_14695, partial [Chloroflexus sp.]|nr:hypothetical protein [Chloroflexus sp.]